MKKSNHTGAIIIGGGVIGAASAYYLSKAGVPVVLVEKEDVASQTSGACNGYIWLGTKKAGFHLKLGKASLELMKVLMEEMGDEVEHDLSGEMLLIETEDDLEGMQEFVTKQREAGVDIRILTRYETKEMQPAVAEERIVGATYSPLGMQVNPIDLVLGYMRRATKMGADIRLRTCVIGIRVESGRAIGVETDQGDIYAPWVVNSGGIFAPEIGRMLGIEIPISPLRGQLLVTEPVPPLIRIPTIESKYLLLKRNPDLLKRTTRSGVTCGIWQSENGNIYLGSSKEFVGYNRGNTFEAMATSAQKAIHFYPQLSPFHIIRAYAGLRPYVEDGIPIVGPVNGIGGFLMAAGHGGDGIALSPITGKLISEFIVNGKTSIPMDELALSRFHS